jgi:hypothetical protein
MKSNMVKPETTNLYSDEYGNLLDMISNNGGFLTIEMNFLRQISGHHRLSTKVNNTIKKALYKRGISHHPNDLPLNNNKKIRLYIKSSTAGSIINSILNVSNQEDSVIHELSKLVLIKQLKSTLGIEDDKSIPIPQDALKNQEVLSIFSSLGKHKN